MVNSLLIVNRQSIVNSLSERVRERIFVAGTPAG